MWLSKSKLLSQCLLFLLLLPAGFLCTCQVSAFTWLWLAIALTLPYGILLPSAVLLTDKHISRSFRFLGQTVIVQLSSSSRSCVLEMANVWFDCPLAQGRHLTHKVCPRRRQVLNMTLPTGVGSGRLLQAPHHLQNRGINSNCFSPRSYINANFICSPSRKVSVTYTGDSWTMWVWTAHVHLYADFFQ